MRYRLKERKFTFLSNVLIAVASLDLKVPNDDDDDDDYDEDDDDNADDDDDTGGGGGDDDDDDDHDNNDYDDDNDDEDDDGKATHMGNKQKKVHLTNGSLQAKGDNAS